MRSIIGNTAYLLSVDKDHKPAIAFCCLPTVQLTTIVLIISDQVRILLHEKHASPRRQCSRRGRQTAAGDVSWIRYID